MPSHRATKPKVVATRKSAKLTDYFSRKPAGVTTSTRSSSPLSSLSCSPAPASDRGSVKNDVVAASTTSSTTRKSSRLSALKNDDITISSSSVHTSASTKSAVKSSATSLSSAFVGSSSLKSDSKPQNERRVTRYRTRQTDSDGASSSKRQPPPPTKPRSISLQVSPAKPAAKRKKPSSYNSDVEESGDAVCVPRVTLFSPSLMKENLPPAQDDRPSLSPSSKKLKLGPTASVVYVASSLSEEHELPVPAAVKRLPEVRESVQRWRASSISFPPPPSPDVEMEDLSAQDDIHDECMEDVSVPSSQSQPCLGPTSAVLPTPSPELPVDTFTPQVSPAPSALTPLAPTSECQSPPSSPRRSSANYRPLSPPPSDFPEEPSADTIEDNGDFIKQLKAEVAAELAMDPQDSDIQSVPDDISDDSSSEEEFRWSPATKASTCVHNLLRLLLKTDSRLGLPLELLHHTPPCSPIVADQCVSTRRLCENSSPSPSLRTRPQTP